MSHYSRSFLTIDDDEDDVEIFQLMSRRIELQHSISPYRHRPIHLSTFSKTRSTPSPLFVLSQSIEFPSPFHFDRRQTTFPFQHFSSRQPSKRRRWKSVGFILIFYFDLKRNLQRAKRKSTYYQRDFHRIRFLELLTGIHRVYFEPNSTIYKCLSTVVHRQSKPTSFLIQCAELFLNELIHFRPQFGILGTSSDESVLIYLLQCSLNDYPRTYFWSIERHLLSLSYTKMKEYQHEHLDHFTTKFIVISTFIFRALTKTHLLKPVKFRLARGQLNESQWLNTRFFSSLILSVARHAIMYKSDRSRLPMPFPFEMKTFLFDDERLENEFDDFQRFLNDSTPKFHSWASKYADRLQNYFTKND